MTSREGIIPVSANADEPSEAMNEFNRAPGAAYAPPEATLWFFVTDTIQWLQDHNQLTGVGRVTYELFKAAISASRSSRFTPCVLAATSSGLAAVDPEETARYLGTRIGDRSVCELLHPYATVPMLSFYPRRGDHVVFTGVIWNQYYSDLFIRLRDNGVSFSVLVHDIIPIESPDLVDGSRSAFIDWLKITVALAKAIYVSSEETRQKIIRWALLAGRVMAADIIIIPFGIPTTLSPQATRDLAPQGYDGVNLPSFVLCVGTIDKRKNQSLICRIWWQLGQELGYESLPQLVLVGRDDLNILITSEDASALATIKKFTLLKELSDSDLSELYRQCAFTVFPSVSEGYGLPVAESLNFGKLCVSSDLPAVRAHAGDLPWYFDPTNYETALSQLRRAITHPDQRLEAERRISLNYVAPTWNGALDRMAGASVRVEHGDTDDYALPSCRLEPIFLRPISVHLALKQVPCWCTSGNPAVSLVIVDRNNGGSVLECIRQIWANTTEIGYEIVIASRHQGPVRGFGKFRHLDTLNGVRVVDLSRHQNKIVPADVRGKYVCMLSDEMFVQAGWLRTLVDRLISERQTGCVVPLVLSEDCHIEEEGEVVLSLRDAWLGVYAVDQLMNAGHIAVDIRRKLHSLGRRVISCPQAKVIRAGNCSAQGR